MRTNTTSDKQNEIITTNNKSELKTPFDKTYLLFKGHCKIGGYNKKCHKTNKI